MSREMGRDDFVISARSVFLKKRNRQKFSLLTLIITSIIILSLEYFKSGPINQARLITKDIIIKSSLLDAIVINIQSTWSRTFALDLKPFLFQLQHMIKDHQQYEQVILSL